LMLEIIKTPIVQINKTPIVINRKTIFLLLVIMGVLLIVTSC
jgi:hypothetical protein